MFQLLLLLLLICASRSHHQIWCSFLTVPWFNPRSTDFTLTDQETAVRLMDANANPTSDPLTIQLIRQCILSPVVSHFVLIISTKSLLPSHRILVLWRIRQQKAQNRISSERYLDWMKLAELFAASCIDAVFTVDAARIGLLRLDSLSNISYCCCYCFGRMCKACSCGRNCCIDLTQSWIARLDSSTSQWAKEIGLSTRMWQPVHTRRRLLLHVLGIRLRRRHAVATCWSIEVLARHGKFKRTTSNS